MVRVSCVRKFVDPREVGQFWDFETEAAARASLGDYFVGNHCEVRTVAAPRQGFVPCGNAGCSECDASEDYNL